MNVSFINYDNVINGRGDLSNATSMDLEAELRAVYSYDVSLMVNHLINGRSIAGMVISAVDPLKEHVSVKPFKVQEVVVEAVAVPVDSISNFLISRQIVCRDV